MPVSPFLDFNPQFTWRQATWAAAVTAVGYLPDRPVGALLESSPYFCKSVTWTKAETELKVNIAYVDTGKTVWIGIEGTTNAAQALAFVDRNGLALVEGIGPCVFKIFWEVAEGCVLDIKSKVTKTQPLVLTGHSLGGASAMLAAYLLKLQGYDVRGVITFGQPYTATAAFFESFSLPYDRVVNHLDVVTKLPQFDSNGDYLLYMALPIGSDRYLAPPRTFVHGGTTRELDQPGFKDDLNIILGELKNLGTRFVSGHVTTHYMGNYVGLVYDRCGPAAKQLFSELMKELQVENSFVLFNGPFPSDDPNTLALNFEAIQAEEQAFAASLIGPQSKVKIRLFKGPYIDPAPGENFTPIEADFPGYAPITPTHPVPISGGGIADCVVGPGWFRWHLSQNLETPSVIGGVFISYIFAEGGERNFYYRPFPSPISLQSEGNSIEVEVTARVARFTD